jgi:hypothetical protein
MRYPLRKKNTVTPTEPLSTKVPAAASTTVENSLWPQRTMRIATARRPSNDGMCPTRDEMPPPDAMIRAYRPSEPGPARAATERCGQLSPL